MRSYACRNVEQSVLSSSESEVGALKVGDGVVRSAETALSEGVCAVRDLDLMWRSADDNHKLE